MKKIIVIGGPTASGKTALAIRCAQHLGTEIISADSRQCYSEMNIGTAKPSMEELTVVQHHFINSHHLPEKVNAGVFASFTLPVLKKLLEEKGNAVIAGGTGLYIRALLEGLDEFPEVPETIRKELVVEFHAAADLGKHLDELREKDPEWYKKVDRNNARRVLRALEIIRTTGKPFSEFLRRTKPEWDADIFYCYPDPPRKVLYERIDNRVDRMIQSGLEEEVRTFRDLEGHPALQTVGYSEFFPYFRGEYDLKTTVSLIKQHTRNYAKRQWTWFRNQGTWKPLPPDSESFKTGQIST